MLRQGQNNLILAAEFPYVVEVNCADLASAHRWCLRRFGGDAYWRTDYTTALRKEPPKAFWTAFNGVFYFKEATTGVVEFKINFG